MAYSGSIASVLQCSGFSEPQAQAHGSFILITSTSFASASQVGEK
jgi:hypothetical protein